MNWKIIHDLKIEIIVWTLIIFSMFNLFFSLPMSAEPMKEIFMGMNVDIPSTTRFIMGFSDFVLHWKMIYFPLMLIFLCFFWWGGVKIMMIILSKIPDSNSDKYIKSQLKILFVVMVVYIITLIFSSVISKSLTMPMMRLVNSV